MSRLLIVVGTIIIALAWAGAMYLALELSIEPNPQTLGPMLLSMTTVAVGAGLALRAIGRARLGEANSVPAIFSKRSVVLAEMIAAAALWTFATIFAAYLVEGGLHPRPSPSANDYGLALILGIPFGVLFPLCAGWIVFAASRLPRPGNEAAALLANALAGFGLLWLVFAGVCTATAGFTGGPTLEWLRPPIAPDIVLSLVLSLAFGAIFVGIGRWLRRATRGRR